MTSTQRNHKARLIMTSCAASRINDVIDELKAYRNDLWTEECDQDREYQRVDYCIEELQDALIGIKGSENL